MKERFGCKNPESLKYKVVVAQTGGTELAAQEPLNNIIRLTVMTLAGMLSGEEGIWTTAHDEALGIPSEEAVQIAVRVQQILAQETDIPHVTDPLGGSYYIEWLTKRMEEEINKILMHIEEQGGFLRAWQSGWLRGESERGAYERLRKLDKGEKIKIGVNKYRMEEVTTVPAFRPSPDAEKIAIERVQRYRRERDNDKTRVALSELRKAAVSIEKEWPQSCGVLMPALIEAARARATLGEMHRVLREVFGYGYYSG
jgi:methylmalonyl-CoA mutase N-terminal domain/subunit